MPWVMVIMKLSEPEASLGCHPIEARSFKDRDAWNGRSDRPGASHMLSTLESKGLIIKSVQDGDDSILRWREGSLTR